MRSRTLFALAAVVVALLALPALAAESKNFENVSMIDVNCSTKFADKLDSHPRACALRCADSGYGIWSEGKYVKFDAAGNEKAKAALEASSAKDKLRVNVSGELEGDTLKVTALALLP